MIRILKNSRYMLRSCGFRAWLRYLALATLLLLNACATMGNSVSVVWHKVTPAEAREICTRFVGPAAFGNFWRGCAVVKSGTCTIYAPDFSLITQREQMATLGHELKHCFDGAWHQ
jgi:hypothetical protein